MSAITVALTGSERLGEPSGQRVHHEMVMDQVFDKTAYVTPFVSYFPREGGAINKRFEWWVQKGKTVTDPGLFKRDPAGANSDWSRSAGVGIVPTRRVHMESFVQNFEVDLEVHDDNEKYDAFGVPNEYLNQADLEMKRLAIAGEKQVLMDTITPSANTNRLGVLNDGANTQMKPLSQLMLQGMPSTQLNFTPNYVAAESMARLTITGSVETGVWNGAGITVNKRLDEDMCAKALEMGKGAADEAMVKFDTCIVNSAAYGHVGFFGGAPSTSGLIGALTIEKAMNVEQIVRVAKMFETNHGQVVFIEDRWVHQAQNTGTAVTFVRGATPIDHPLFGSGTGNYGVAWFLDRSMIDLVFMQPFVHERLPRSGRSTRGMAYGDFGVRLKHPQAVMMVVGVNNV